MRGSKARRLRREFIAENGRKPLPVNLGGKTTRFVDRKLTAEEKATRTLARPIRIGATLFEKVVRASESRAWKRAHA